MPFCSFNLEENDRLIVTYDKNFSEEQLEYIRDGLGKWLAGDPKVVLFGEGIKFYIFSTVSSPIRLRPFLSSGYSILET